MDEATVEQRRDGELHKDEATRLQHLEARSKIARLYHKKGMSVSAIGKKIGMSPKKVQWYLDWSVERVLDIPEGERKLPEKPRRPARTKAKPLPHLTGTPSAGVVRPGLVVSATSSPGVPAIPDPATQKQAFYLRARGVPSDEIAELLGIPESDAERAIMAWSDRLNASEINTTETARRVQLAQLDTTLRALSPHATGVNEDGSPHPLDLFAVDRYLKVLDQKAKLLGLNAVQRVDINQRLEMIASEGQYDLEDLQELLVEVLREMPQLALTGR